MMVLTNQRTSPAKPVFALYQDTIAGTETKFKPYTVDAQIAWIDQLEVLREHLNRWR